MGLFFLHNTRELTHQYFPNVFFISALQKSAQFQKGIAGHMKIWQKKISNVIWTKYRWLQKILGYFLRCIYHIINQ